MNKTLQREAILKMLAELNNHPTADEIYMNLRKIMPQISLATVYRNLEIMAKTGKIKKLETPDRKHYDAETAKHFHVFCPTCGKISNARLDALYQLKDDIDREIQHLGFDDCKFELISYCHNCLTAAKILRDNTPPKKKILSLLD